MKFYLPLVLFSIMLILMSCGQANDKELTATMIPKQVNGTPDPDKGIGKFRDVHLDSTLDIETAAKGGKVFELKCSPCHKLTDEKLVGPGWKGVTVRHRPEWILNFTTNVDEMLANDPSARSQLDLCLVRMPDQGLTNEDARNILEFMRKNDSVHD